MDKERSIIIQAVLKSVIESGAKKDQWFDLTLHGLSVYSLLYSTDRETVRQWVDDKKKEILDA